VVNATTHHSTSHYSRLTSYAEEVFVFGITPSLRNKLLLACLAVGLVPLVLFGFLLLARSTKAADDTRLRDAAVAVLKKRVQNYVQEYKQAALHVAHQPKITDQVEAIGAGEGDRKARVAALTAALKDRVKGLSDLSNLLVCDKDGTVLADSADKEAGQSKKGDAAFKYYFADGAPDPKKKHDEVYLQTLTGGVGAQPMVLSAAIRDRSNQVLGAVLLQTKGEELLSAANEDFGFGSASFVTNKEDGVWLGDDVGLGLKLGKEAAVADSTPRWQLGAALLIAVVLAVAVGLGISRTMSGQLKHINDVFSQIGIGNFQARVQVTSQDELGTLANNMNGMLDNTLQYIQSRDERDSIQASIQKLLEEVSGVAEGDLTREAEVTADVTGAIADSFNYMIEQLRNIISNVQEATLQVSSQANKIQATAENLAQGSETQAAQIVNTSAAIDEMAVSIQQVSQNAATSAQVAQQSLHNAKQGAELVQNTIHGMNRIRDQVQETAKRIKRLGESSQEIGQIIQLIDDIADRTSILALNASIQAAMAGEAGRGFAVVAEEVERLAVRATDATKKIATLVKTIQSETNEAGLAMEKGIQEVVEGSKLANQAGVALTEIEGVSNRLAELMQSISLASSQQARGSEALARSMNEISQITQQTAAGTKQAAESVSQLATLADELRASVSTFRLPSDNGKATKSKSSIRLPASASGSGSKTKRPTNAEIVL
jgi:methyl-accepting chemotaxis protein